MPDLNSLSTKQLIIGYLRCQTLASASYKKDLGLTILESIGQDLNIPFFDLNSTDVYDSIIPSVEFVSELLILKIQSSLHSVNLQAINIVKSRLDNESLRSDTFDDILCLYKPNSLPSDCNLDDLCDFTYRIGSDPLKFKSVSATNKNINIPLHLPATSFNRDSYVVSDDTLDAILSPSKEQTLGPINCLDPQNEQQTSGIFTIDETIPDRQPSPSPIRSITTKQVASNWIVLNNPDGAPVVHNSDINTFEHTQDSKQPLTPSSNSNNVANIKPNDKQPNSSTIDLAINDHTSLQDKGSIEAIRPPIQVPDNFDEHQLADIIIFEPHLPPIFIKDKDNPLSNFNLSEFSMDGVIFKSIEHALQYYKAKHFDDHNLALKILNSPMAGSIKILTKDLDNIIATKRHIKGNDKALDWLSIRDHILTNILEARFSQVTSFRHSLINSGYRKVLLCVKDTHYGTGAISRSSPQGSGSNVFGIHLMELRQRHSANSYETFHDRTTRSTLGPVIQPKITSVFATNSNLKSHVISGSETPCEQHKSTTPVSTRKRPAGSPLPTSPCPVKNRKKSIVQTTINPTSNRPLRLIIRNKPWTLPPKLENRPLLISDEQGSISDKAAPRDFQIISLHGAKLENITALFKEKVFSNVTTVFLQAGSYNKDQNFLRTSKKVLSKTISQLTKSFPHAQLIFIPIHYDKYGTSLSAEQKINLRDLNLGFQAKHTMVPFPKDFKPSFDDSGFIVTPGTQNQIVSFINDFLLD